MAARGRRLASAHARKHPEELQRRQAQTDRQEISASLLRLKMTARLFPWCDHGFWFSLGANVHPVARRVQYSSTAGFSLRILDLIDGNTRRLKPALLNSGHFDNAVSTYIAMKTLHSLANQMDYISPIGFVVRNAGRRASLKHCLQTCLHRSKMSQFRFAQNPRIPRSSDNNTCTYSKEDSG